VTSSLIQVEKSMRD